MRSAVLIALTFAAASAVRHSLKSAGAPPKFNLKGKVNNANPQVSIDSPRKRVGEESSVMFGLNLPAWNEKEFIDEFGKPAIDSSFNSIRFPGGSWANKYIWNMDFKSYPYFSNLTEITKNPNIIDTKMAVQLANSSGSQLLIQVNYAVARVYGAEEAGKLAAKWVKYIRQELNYPLAYIEVGNENYGKWEVPFSGGPKHYKVDGKLYGQDFNVIQRHIKAVSPDIKVGAVLSINSGIGTRDTALNQDEITKDWNQQVLTACGKNTDFVTTHSYFADNPHPLSLFKYVGFGPNAVRNMVDTQMKKFVPGRKERMPIAMTEFNIQMPPRDQTVNMVNGLFLAKFLGECMESGIFMTQLWGLRTKWRASAEGFKELGNGKKQATAAYGGEYGIFSNDQPGVKKHTPRATLYTEYIFKRIFSEGRHMVKATSDASDLMVFAAGKENSDESVGMVLVNLGNQEKTMKLAGVPQTKNAEMWVLQGEGGKLEDRRFMMNQAKSSNSTAPYGGPWPLTTIPRKTVNTADSIKVPPFSVVGVLAKA